MLYEDIFNIAKRCGMSIKGMDINVHDYAAIETSPDASTKMKHIIANEEYRMATISGNLIKLQNEGKGVIFLCGALHAENLINKLKEQNIDDDRVVYYFLHSGKNYVDGIDDVKEYLSNDTLKNHTFRLINDNDRKSLKNRIVREIKSKNTMYKKEIIGGTANSRFLTDFFKHDFKAFVRPGYYVDALLDMTTEGVNEIANKLQEANIQTRVTSVLGNTYLVVQEINTPEIANKIRLLK